MFIYSRLSGDIMTQEILEWLLVFAGVFCAVSITILVLA